MEQTTPKLTSKEWKYEHHPRNQINLLAKTLKYNLNINQINKQDQHLYVHGSLFL